MLYPDDQPNGPNASASPHGERASRGLILYIEDNSDNRILIKRVLEAEGYEVVLADSGAQGMIVAATGVPDLILMDINLPDVDGYTCTRLLRQQSATRRVPILALTANVLEGDRQKALEAGCNGYIPKPIDVDDLPVQIAAHIATPRVRPAAADPRPGSSAPGDNAPPASEQAPAASPLPDAERATHKGQVK